MQRRDSRISIKHCQQPSLFLPIDNLLDNPESTDKDYEVGDGIWNFVDYDSKEVDIDTWDNYNEDEEDERRSNYVCRGSRGPPQLSARP